MTVLTAGCAAIKKTGTFVPAEERRNACFLHPGARRLQPRPAAQTSGGDTTMPGVCPKDQKIKVSGGNDPEKGL
jgi:hypothetical protein